MPESTDVVIIGAGAAGLSVANALCKKNRDVLIVEARDRIGGRIWTLHPESLSVPVELGAEFIHGPAEEVIEIAEREKLATVDIAEHRWGVNVSLFRPRRTSHLWLSELMSEKYFGNGCDISNSSQSD